jgi:thiamine phosphate synthase YjbQ (UPF0047 family)
VEVVRVLTERKTQLVDVTEEVRTHWRAALAGSSVTIPLVDGELALGNLQAIYLCEFDGPRDRELRVVVT